MRENSPSPQPELNQARVRTAFESQTPPKHDINGQLRVRWSRYETPLSLIDHKLPLVHL